jgi:hypothetical protein
VGRVLVVRWLAGNLYRCIERVASAPSADRAGATFELAGWCFGDPFVLAAALEAARELADGSAAEISRTR